MLNLVISVFLWSKNMANQNKQSISVLSKSDKIKNLNYFDYIS